MTNDDESNAVPVFRWLMAASAIIFEVIILLSLAADFLPHRRCRRAGYAILIAALGICCWLWGWLTRGPR